MGSGDILSLRSVEGDFYRLLEETQAASWTSRIASMFTTDQGVEEYPWLGHVPSMRRWVGERMSTQLPGYGIEVRSEKFENGIDIEEDDLRRDKTGQLEARIAELASKAAILEQQLLTELLTDNAVAYDQKAMFASDHVVGDSGTIDNDLAVAVTTASAPTSDEMVRAILDSVQQMMGFKDDTGEPMADMAREFAVMIPTHLWQATIASLRDEFTAAGVSNTLQSAMGTGFQITPYVNARLTGDVFYTFRTDTRVKPFIWQDELMEPQTLGRDSDHYVKHDAYFFGVKRLCAAAPGRFEFAIRTTLQDA